MRSSYKDMRGEKRAPAMPVMVSTGAVVAVCLVAIWVFSGPTERFPGDESSVAKSTADSLNVTQHKTTDLPKSQEAVDAPSHLGADDETAEEFRNPEKTLPESDTRKDDEKLDDLPGEVKQEESVPVTNVDLDELPGKLKKEKSKSVTNVVPDEVPGEEEHEENVPVTSLDVDDVSEETAVKKDPVRDEAALPGDKAELSVEKDEASTSSLITQGKKSKEEKIQEIIQNAGTVEEKDIIDDLVEVAPLEPEMVAVDEGTYIWEVCSWDGAQDYIPCLDNKEALKKLKSTKHYEHRERHCPVGDSLPTCLVPLPEGYKSRVDWPKSRDQVWYANVPHDKLVTYKQDQNWVQKKDDYLVFPGGGTQFKLGAMPYIESIQKIWKDITWGKHVRTVLDVGCGVASFGGFLFDKDVLTMSFAPKDEHDAQVQMALERGIPAILSVMGTKRLIFPSNVFDVLHCARCRVPWHDDGGKLLLELNRILRPGGYFVWSATPVYRTNDLTEVAIWKATKKIADAMCWKLLVRTKADLDTMIGMAIFQKPENNSCYDKRKIDVPPMCAVDDKADAAWYVDMNSCLHRIPTGDGVRATSWPVDWPLRVETSPKWLKSIPKGMYGKPAAVEFASDYKHWQHVFGKSYLKGLGIKWVHIRNVLDMKSGYGGFGALLSSQRAWVMNVVPTDEPDTLPIIYDRGLFGVYHDWCESFSTYPRTYDLLHADHVFVKAKKRCNILTILIEMDRILRPDGWVIFRDSQEMLGEIEEIIKSLHWDIKTSYEHGNQRLLAAQKGIWRPKALP